MFITTATVPTPSASLYIKKLCKHFAHRIEVSFDDERGECKLPIGPVKLLAKPDALHVQIQVQQQSDLEKAKDIIESHFVRFAHKENIQTMDWVDQ
ncbi:DUF2218 domain-containing protein [Gynuella sp.]|uniref:DUF2218 domain-containing protein n=1 Tax=Gynuella sp. TaxID=2969146 RepID=UPI003D0D15FC